MSETKNKDKLSHDVMVLAPGLVETLFCLFFPLSVLLLAEASLAVDKDKQSTKKESAGNNDFPNIAGEQKHD